MNMYMLKSRTVCLHNETPGVLPDATPKPGFGCKFPGAAARDPNPHGAPKYHGDMRLYNYGRQEIVYTYTHTCIHIYVYMCD